MSKTTICAIYEIDGPEFTGLVASTEPLSQEEWQVLVVKARRRFIAIAEAEDETDTAFLSGVTEEEWRHYERGELHLEVVLMNPDRGLSVPATARCEW
jgi:hypothetical protein